MTLLSVADRLATRGRKADEAIAKHLELAREVLPAALAWRARGPPPAARARRRARRARSGSTPGRELGRLLAAIDEARFAGEVATPDEAIALAERLRDADRAPTANLRGRWPPIPTASSARSSPARSRRRSSPRTSARSRSWTSSPANRGHALVIPRAHASDVHEIDPEDLAGRRGHGAADRRAARRAARRRRREPPELQRRRRLADGLPLPHARHPALRRRPAAAAVGPGAGRHGRDRRRRRASSPRADRQRCCTRRAAASVMLADVRARPTSAVAASVRPRAGASPPRRSPRGAALVGVRARSRRPRRPS